MRPVLQSALIAVILAFLPAASAQEKTKAKEKQKSAGHIHTMVIQNGQHRSVHYFGTDAPASEMATLRDLERSQNEVAYLDSIQALRRQYIDSERRLALRRATLQDRLYGITMEGGSGFSFTANSPYRYFSEPYYPAGYGYGFGYGCGAGGYGGAPGETFTLSGSNRVTQSLANGVGDEGRLKAALVGTIAAQTSPEYSQAVGRSYNAALARAGESERLREMLGLGKDGAAPAEKPAKATLTLKSGDKVEGTLVREDGDWYVLETGSDEVSVRKSEVNRISKPRGKQ